MLAVLGLFTIDHPEWTVDAAAEQLAVSATTAYRYFKRLTNAGLLSPVSRASYVLGPAIVQMDRQIQMCDPMLRAARRVMGDLVQYANDESMLVLSRLFHDRVMCVHQVMGRGGRDTARYERGRLMPLFHGATSKIILAHLPPRTLKSLFSRNAATVAEAGLGDTWDAFRHHLAALRREGVAIARGEIDPGRVGIAAPVFEHHAILGSLSFVVPADRIDDTLIGRLAPLTIAGAREIEKAMDAIAAPAPVSPARVRVAR